MPLGQQKRHRAHEGQCRRQIRQVQGEASSMPGVATPRSLCLRVTTGLKQRAGQSAGYQVIYPHEGVSLMVSRHSGAGLSIGSETCQETCHCTPHVCGVRSGPAAGSHLPAFHRWQAQVHSHPMLSTCRPLSSGIDVGPPSMVSMPAMDLQEIVEDGWQHAATQAWP